MQKSERLQIRIAPYYLAALTIMAEEDGRSKAAVIERLIEARWDKTHPEDSPLTYEPKKR